MSLLNESDSTVGVLCGHCGGEVHMVTCDQMRDTGHYWVLWSECLDCAARHATAEQCLDCAEVER